MDQPPFDVVTKVLDKLIHHKTRAILLVPVWPWTCWWKFVLKYSLQSIRIQQQPGLFYSTGSYRMNTPLWDIQAFYFDFSILTPPQPVWYTTSSLQHLYNTSLHHTMLYAIKRGTKRGPRLVKQTEIPTPIFQQKWDYTSILFFTQYIKFYLMA